MATAKLPLLLLTLSLLAAAAAAAEDAIAGETSLAKEADLQLRAELEQLRSKISALESSISDRTRELEGKDDRIAQLEKTLLEKTASIVSLQGEIELSQKKGAVDAEKIIRKVQQRAEELEKEVEDNKKEIETQNRVREALESRASDAEKKVQELILKVENLEMKNEEQKRIIQKTERALIVAEEELMRTQLEATSKSKELIKVHGAWLPPWLANFICHFQDLAVIHWNEHGKPVVNVFLQKASEKSAQVQELAKPHLETVKTKWIPVAKDQWVTFTTHVGPYVDTVSTKTVEFYTICSSSITPHVIKVQEFANPHLQKVSEFAKPHIDKISSFTKPHVENVRAVLKPYTEHLAHAYGEFLKSATLYHQQVHGLPPLLANFMCHFQDLAVIHWNEHGNPAVNVFLEKASEKSAQVQELAKPHLETIKTKWIPVTKDQWVTFTTHVGPYVDTVSTKTVEFYTICRSSITPHVIKVQEFAYPHLQKVSESAKPHIDKISSFTKPHVEKVRAVLKPYTEHLAHAYREFLKSATLYHQQASEKSAQVQELAKPHLETIKTDLAVIHWNEHGKPAVNVFLEKASEKSAQVQELTKPHLETIKTKWIPVAKDQWVTFTTHVGPYVDTVSTKTVEFYTICRSSITPHVIKVQEFTYPHLQKVSESAKPHIDKISSFTKPHVEKVRAVLKPYTEHLAYAYGEFLKSATLYHQQAEALIQEKLKKHELTNSLATKELVWFMASALLALPVFVLYRIFCVMFCKKSRKPTMSANAKNTSRKPKRSYADK